MNPVERHPPFKIQRTGLQGLLVLAGARSTLGTGHRNTTRRHRRRAPEALQRQHDRRGPQESKKSLDPKIATMEGDASAYDQSDATGFIRLNALRLKLRALLKQTRGS